MNSPSANPPPDDVAAKALADRRRAIAGRAANEANGTTAGVVALPDGRQVIAHSAMPASGPPPRMGFGTGGLPALNDDEPAGSLERIASRRGRGTSIALPTQEGDSVEGHGVVAGFLPIAGCDVHWIGTGWLVLAGSIDVSSAYPKRPAIVIPETVLPPRSGVIVIEYTMAYRSTSGDEAPTFQDSGLQASEEIIHGAATPVLIEGFEGVIGDGVCGLARSVSRLPGDAIAQTWLAAAFISPLCAVLAAGIDGRKTPASYRYPLAGWVPLAHRFVYPERPQTFVYPG